MSLIEKMLNWIRCISSHSHIHQRWFPPNIHWTYWNSFKTRYTNHKASFKKYDKRNATELSKYIWHLQANNISYNVKWRILKRARPYNPVSKRCNLCLWEKYFIIFKPEMASLNKRNELVSSCRHANKFLLKALIIWIYRVYRSCNILV